MIALGEKVAIVTGASSGIGRAAAKLFAREGAAAVAAARRGRELDSLVAGIVDEGGSAVARAGDIRDEAFAASLVDTATEAFGGLDIAFNTAGTLGEIGAVSEVSLAGWHDTLETNLTSAFLCAKHQVPAMANRGGGSIVFTSTFVGTTAGFPGMAAYAASNAGLIGLTQVLAVECGTQAIRVNALLPGGTDTAVGRQAANTPEAMRQVAGLHAVKRIAVPEEIAQSALFLASDAASFVIGSAFLVDGGVSIARA